MPKLKCCYCKERFPKETMIKLPIGNVCTHEHAIAKANEVQEKARKKAQAKAKADKAKSEKADRKQAVDARRKKLGWQHKQTQKAFNKMRVLEELVWFQEHGQEPSCISCGKPKGNDLWSCGHFKTVGSQSILRYDVRNSFLQHSYNCNRCLSGDIYGTKATRGYINGLLERFGEVEGQAIIDYCKTTTGSPKWTWQELEEMRAGFRVRIKELEEKLECLEPTTAK